LNKIFHYIKKLPFIKKDNALAQLIRTYIVGGANLFIGLLFNYIFQFFIFNSIEIPLRTLPDKYRILLLWRNNILFFIKKDYLQTIFKKRKFKRVFQFLSYQLNKPNPPLLIWYVIDRYKPSIQENELQFILSTVLIHGSILPLKYLIYKFFVFKDSLDS
jgi:hypothetical protein